MGETPRPEAKPVCDMLSHAERIARMIRVDQAGEYGAVRIYQGQRAVLGGRASDAALAKMEAAEREHLATFNALMVERRVRPTALQPLWHLAGFALGATTAMLGERAAMACTVAVEEVIEAHYARQAARLEGRDEARLRDEIERARMGEIEHRDAALAAGARQAPGYTALTAAVKGASRLAIWLSERI